MVERVEEGLVDGVRESPVVQQPGLDLEANGVARLREFIAGEQIGGMPRFVAQPALELVEIGGIEQCLFDFFAHRPPQCPRLLGAGSNATHAPACVMAPRAVFEPDTLGRSADSHPT